MKRLIGVLIAVVVLINVAFIARRLTVSSEVRAMRKYLAEAPAEFERVSIERSKPGMYVVRGVVPNQDAFKALSQRVSKVSAGRFVVLVEVERCQSQ